MFHFKTFPALLCSLIKKRKTIYIVRSDTSITLSIIVQGNAEFMVLGVSRLAWFSLGSRCRFYMELNRYFNGNLQRNGMHGRKWGITVNTWIERLNSLRAKLWRLTWWIGTVAIWIWRPEGALAAATAISSFTRKWHINCPKRDFNDKIRKK